MISIDGGKTGWLCRRIKGLIKILFWKPERWRILGRRVDEMIILKSILRRQCRIVRVGLKWLYWRRPVHMFL